eukprot:PhF_6_TR41576/c1_g1_i3/m.63004/K13208/ELAVL2_3_4; ELAV like protein 2/3/4
MSGPKSPSQAVPEEMPSLFNLVSQTTSPGQPVSPLTPAPLSNNNNSQTSQTSLINVFITGLPSDFDEPRLRALFSVYGEITSCKIMLDVNTGTSKGFGFVRYQSPADAAKAIESMNGKKLAANSTKVLSVSLAQHDGNPTVTECERIYIRNVPSYVEDRDVFEVFKEFGEIVESRVMRYTQSECATSPLGKGLEGHSKGVAFVKFKTVEEAVTAISRMQGTRPFTQDPTFTKPLMVRFAENHEARHQRQLRAESSGSIQLTTNPMSLSQPGLGQSILSVPSTRSSLSFPAPGSQSISVNTTPAAVFVWEDQQSAWMYTTTVSQPTPTPHHQTVFFPHHHHHHHHQQQQAVTPLVPIVHPSQYYSQSTPMMPFLQHNNQTSRHSLPPPASFPPPMLPPHQSMMTTATTRVTPNVSQHSNVFYPQPPTGPF